jgi:septal ring factor EnvC (AmiA/AmiB activator)
MKKLSRKLLPVAFMAAAIFVVAFSGFGQDRNQLERSKKLLSEKIKSINILLAANEGKKTDLLTNLNIISAKIEFRTQLLRTIQKEVQLVNTDIRKKNLELTKLQTELDELKDNYAHLIRQSFLLKAQQSNLLFVLSSSTFYQAYARMQYLDMFTKYRKSQGEKISKKQLQIEREIAKLKVAKEQKAKLLVFQKSEAASLKKERELQRVNIAELKKEEKGLKKELQAQQKEQKKIALAIKELIEKEIKASRKSSGGKFKLTPEALKLSNNFAANYGKLPWPVEKGIITGKFGKQPHPVISGVTIENNGVTISTEKAAPVRSIFSGTVSSILLIPGSGKVVVLSHGAYRTVYTNLKEVFVTKGQKVSTKEYLGTIVEKGSKNEAHLEIWKISQSGTQKLNPSKWLYH